MLNVVMLSVVMLNVVAPYFHRRIFLRSLVNIHPVGRGGGLFEIYKFHDNLILYPLIYKFYENRKFEAILKFLSKKKLNRQRKETFFCLKKLKFKVIKCAGEAATIGQMSF